MRKTTWKRSAFGWFMSDQYTEMKLWRNYRQGKVGIQIGNHPRLLIDPEEAQRKAAQMIETAGQLDPEHQPQARKIANQIREYANELEALDE